MKDRQIIKTTTDYLFGCDFKSDRFDPEGEEKHLDKANELISTFLWSDIFEEWNDYLHNNCSTPESVINFCNLFYYYGGQDQFIPNPYEFLGYLYYVIDVDTYWNQAGNLLDSISISILEKSGEISLSSDPDYQPWNDPKLLKVIESYKNRGGVNAPVSKS